MRLVACLHTDFDMEIQHSQLKIIHLSDTPSTKAAGGGIFSGVFTQGRPGTTQGQEDFAISWYLFFQEKEKQKKYKDALICKHDLSASLGCRFGLGFWM
jgi:hypothetical protein